MPSTKENTPYDSAFDLLDMEEPERELTKLKSDKMISIRELISEQGLNQTKAAQITKTTQPRISRLLSGAFRDFSFDMLFLIEARLKAHK